ncbi:hypothetical protein I3J27_23695 [Bradyrhizobium xenonodulans]|uniref:Helix-turn-helix domain-containing protein n=1 Tax=Bradyrhizobium xenonodulans TaxID=2736875 RepID=A0ABY7MCG7_9BRAD|nr:hypothetical protein [Bradyrhizobium xenonodulans]WBL76028.1 hypothetical protein I3J27_23695 [Bradyrhizobium xenonodulans]
MTAISSAMPKAADDPAADRDPHAAINELKQTIAVLAARVTQLEQTPEEWLPLKAAAHDADVVYETARLWAKAGLIQARRVGKRWFVNVASLKARKQVFAR